MLNIKMKKIIFLASSCLIISTLGCMGSKNTHEKSSAKITFTKNIEYSQRLLEEIEKNDKNLDVIIHFDQNNIGHIQEFFRKNNIIVQSYIDDRVLINLPQQFLKNDFFIKNNAIFYMDLQNKVYESDEFMIEKELSFLNYYLKDYPNKNFAFSPYSIEQINIALDLANKESKSTISENVSHKNELISAFNTIWYEKKYDIYPEFSTSYQQYLEGNIFAIDFKNSIKAEKIINKKIAEQSKNRIKNLVSSRDIIQNDVILSNVVYFKSDWLNTFDINKTQKMPFYNSDKIQQVDMMFATKSVRVSQYLDWEWIEIPFQQEKSYLEILLPPQSKNEIELTQDIYLNLKNNYKFQNVNISMPKLKLVTDTTNLSQLLSNQHNGKLDFLLKDQEVKNLSILHQVNIEWDEQGAEAAAASIVVSKGLVSSFNVDRPFLFLIRQDRDIIFMGYIHFL